MLACPRCPSFLQVDHDHRGMCWSCQSCGGELLTVTSLRTEKPGVVAELKRAPRLRENAASHLCPMCRKGMSTIAAGGPPPLPLEVCDPCRVIWFDRHEYDLLFPKRDLRPAVGIGTPSSSAMPGVSPWLTWALITVCVGASILHWSMGRIALDQWEFLPLDPLRHHGLTLLTSFFLHAHPGHLLGSVLALWSFGDDAEETLGRWRYALLLAGATIVGCLVQGLSGMGPHAAMIGASGGLAGLITYFCLRFPHKDVVVNVTHPLTWSPIPMSAITWMTIWLLFQIGSGIWAAAHGATVIYAAQLAGAAVGVAWYFGARLLVPVTVEDRKLPWWKR